MRDLNRIDRILEMIKENWLRNPDQRFFQFCINNGLMKDDNEYWNIEDDDVEEQLKYITEQRKTQ